MNVTVTRAGRAGGDPVRARYRLEFDRLPGRAFGPYSFGEAKSQLEFACDLPMPVARGLVCDAFLTGSATLNTEARQ